MTREIFEFFEFKEFSMRQGRSGQRINTDSCVFGDLLEAKDPRATLDIGTGTGVLALMMAAKFPSTHITGIEINPEYAVLAAENFAGSPWASRLSLDVTAAQEFAKLAPGKFDLIACNPPFFSGSTRSRHPDRAMARHDDTLSPVELADVIRRILAPSGRVWILAAARDETKWIAALKEAMDLYVSERVELTDNPGAFPHAVALCLDRVRDGSPVVISRRIDYRQDRGGEKSPWMIGHRARWFP